MIEPTIWQRLTARPRLFVSVVLAAAVLLYATGMGVLVAAESGAFAGAGSASSRTPPPHDTPLPTLPPANPANAGWTTYVGVILPDLRQTNMDLFGLATACRAGNTDACAADAQGCPAGSTPARCAAEPQGLAKDVQAAQAHLIPYTDKKTGLSTVTTPCLVAIDRQYRALLALLARTAQELATGSMTPQAAGDLTTARDALLQTTRALDAATGGACT